MLATGVYLGDYNVSQAIQIAVDILFFNANSLYGLEEDEKYPQLLSMCGRTSYSFPFSQDSTLSIRQSSTIASDVVSHSSPRSASDILTFKAFLSKHPDVKYIWLQSVDYTTTIRGRMIPVNAFMNILRTGKLPSLTLGLLRIIQTDVITEGGSATGQFQLQPDLNSLTVNAGLDAVSSSATCQTFWLQDGTPFPIQGCPRSTLINQLSFAHSSFGITFLMGFEIEICFCKPVTDPATGKTTSFAPISNVHAWNTQTTDQLKILPMIEQVVETLSSIGINLTMFHAESAPGQWEFVLPPDDPLKATDMLFKARQTIAHVALSHGLKATVYPRPYPGTCGSACHAHFSLQSGIEYEETFLAGILDHLPAILALSLPIEESYERVKDGIWAGGEWVAWGYQNKETPIRKIEPGRYELKTLDGHSNTYLAIAALIAAGLDGVRSKKGLTLRDCPFDVSQMSEDQRARYGIKTRLPGTLEEALEKLKGDRVLLDALGRDFVGNYVAVKMGERGFLKEMGEEERRVWIMERY